MRRALTRGGLLQFASCVAVAFTSIACLACGGKSGTTSGRVSGAVIRDSAAATVSVPSRYRRTEDVSVPTGKVRWTTSGWFDYRRGIGVAMNRTAGLSYEERFLGQNHYLGPLKGSHANVASLALGTPPHTWTKVTCSAWLKSAKLPPSRVIARGSGGTALWEDPATALRALKVWASKMNVRTRKLGGKPATEYVASIDVPSASSKSAVRVGILVDDHGFIRQVREEAPGYKSVLVFYGFGTIIGVSAPRRFVRQPCKASGA
jgi:hypothetical protein